ncbi:MAG: hypothetical protein IJI67_07125 [Clostridia bacterium]|nr:hypothetical protein [Clostridia bacterium]
MKKYVKPEIELLKFSVEDVILASGVGHNSNSTEPTSSEWSGYYPPPGRRRS